MTQKVLQLQHTTDYAEHENFQPSVQVVFCSLSHTNSAMMESKIQIGFLLHDTRMGGQWKTQ